MDSSGGLVKAAASMHSVSDRVPGECYVPFDCSHRTMAPGQVAMSTMLPLQRHVHGSLSVAKRQAYTCAHMHASTDA